MKVERNFICFGCQEKGDVIRFAEKLFNLQPSDAARKLVEDFGLNVTAPKTDPVKPPPEKHAHPVNGVRIVKTIRSTGKQHMKKRNSALRNRSKPSITSTTVLMAIG